MKPAKPVVILAPAPQKRDRIFSSSALERLHDKFEVIDLEENTETGLLERHLPDAFAVVGQPDLGTDALESAIQLRAIVNVEGNFFPNVDYPKAFANGIRVLGSGPAYSQAVAEYALALALDLARGISREDRAMRRGDESWVPGSNIGSILLRNARIGFVGYGNIGRALQRLLEPFTPSIRAFDPWLPESVILEANLIPSTLDETLSESDFVFVLAAVTTENAHLIDAEMLAMLPDQARLILVSRAAVVDYDALLDKVKSGSLLVGIDVWPTEPLSGESEFRTQENVILSAHRAGGIRQAFHSIGDMVCDDLELMARGLPPLRMQIAAPELVTRYRSKPVD